MVNNKFIVLSLFTSLLLVGSQLTKCNPNEEKEDIDLYTVATIFQAKLGKEESLKKELMRVKRSEQEPSCVEYRVDEDIWHSGRVALYEKWTSKEDRAKQFEKLRNALEDILAIYEVVFES